MNFPEDIEILKGKVAGALVPICSAVDKGTKAEMKFLFTVQRTGAGR